MFVVTEVNSALKKIRCILGAFKAKLATRKYEMLVLLSIIINTIFISYFTIMKFNAFRTYVDLGGFDQAFWTTTKEGKFFVGNADKAVNPSGNAFGVHFMPILILLLPVYAVFPSVSTLLIVKALVLSIGALPVYWIAKDKTGNQTVGLTFALMYLTNPLLHGTAWYDFSVEAFIPALFLFSFHYLESRSWSKFFLCVFLTLMIFEPMAYFVAVFGVYIVLRSIHKRQTHKLDVDKKLLLLGLTVVFLSLLWLLLSSSIIHFFNPNWDNPSIKAPAFWETLGVSGPEEIPAYVILHPDRAINALQFDSQTKFLFLLTIFAPLFFLPLLEPLTLLPSVPWFLMTFLSNNGAYYHLGWQYNAFPIPFLFVAAIGGMAKIIEFSSKHHLKKFIILLGTCSILFVIISLPYFTLYTFSSYLNSVSADYAPIVITQRELKMQELIAMIPPDASVIAQNNLFPHFAERANAYVVPLFQYWWSKETKEHSLDLVLSTNSDYIVVDRKTDNVGTLGMFFSRWDAFLNYETAASFDGFTILQRKDILNLNFKPEPIDPLVWMTTEEMGVKGKKVEDQGVLELISMPHNFYGFVGTINYRQFIYGELSFRAKFPQKMGQIGFGDKGSTSVIRIDNGFFETYDSATGKQEFTRLDVNFSEFQDYRIVWEKDSAKLFVNNNLLANHTEGIPSFNLLIQIFAVSTSDEESHLLLKYITIKESQFFQP